MTKKGSAELYKHDKFQCNYQIWQLFVVLKLLWIENTVLGWAEKYIISIYIYISFIKFTKILISATLNAVKITAIYGYQISLFWSGKTKTSLQIYKGILESF